MDFRIAIQMSTLATPMMLFTRSQEPVIQVGPESFVDELRDSGLYISPTDAVMTLLVYDYRWCILARILFEIT